MNYLVFDFGERGYTEQIKLWENSVSGLDSGLTFKFWVSHGSVFRLREFRE